MATAFSDQTTMLSCLSNLCTLQPEELILTDLLQDKSDGPLCHNCDELSKATSQCKDCDELLCSECVSAHIRVKLTKDHFIVPLEDSMSSPSFTNKSSGSTSSNPTSVINGNIFCESHISETVKLYCDTCFTSICTECTTMDHRGHSVVYLQDALDSARSVASRLLSDAKTGARSAKECIELSQRMIVSIGIRSHSIARDVRGIMRKFQLAIEERERELLNKIEKARVLKQKALQMQIEGFKSLQTCYAQTSDTISSVLDVGSSTDILQAKDNAVLELKRLRTARGNMPLVDDEIVFTPPDLNLLLLINSTGEVMASGLTFGSDSILRTAVSQTQQFQQNKNNCIDDMTNGTEQMPPFLSLDAPTIGDSDQDMKMWTPSPPFRNNGIDISPLNARLNHSTFSSSIFGPNRIGRNYTDAGRPKLIIGAEGEKEGHLCRPWGVCCDLKGNIIVADRSNNRVQIFRSDGTFLRKFGSYGADPGNFDRPAGVAVDPLGRIVVTDKDNHRVQIFTGDGKFLFTFGEKGSKPGQFNYPWDVAVDYKGKIVVSDTRNHRIQMFSMDGTFLGKYGFENTANMVKHFDSPRGVCFGAKGCVIVTDFNNHRLVVIDPNFRNARFLGTEGTSIKQFLRPQGVAVDAAGNIIVADSRNNRIQVFEPNGSFLWKFGSPGKEAGQLDRPSGVCLTPEGRIVVVDFGNNRLQIF